MFNRRRQGTYVEASFSCVVCKRTFTSKASMNRHKKAASQMDQNLWKICSGSDCGKYGLLLVMWWEKTVVKLCLKYNKYQGSSMI